MSKNEEKLNSGHLIIPPFSENDWYSAKTVYKHDRLENGIYKAVFEERIVVFLAHDLDDAISKAEIEAAEYCAKGENVRYLNFVNVFKLFAERLTNGSEIYSLMRESELSADDYLDRFYDDGNERTKTAR
jgi:hypothetical protein